MSVEYNKTKAGGIDTAVLISEINSDPTISPKVVDYILYDDPNLTVAMDLSLTGAEETALDAVISSHTPPTALTTGDATVKDIDDTGTGAYIIPELCIDTAIARVSDAAKILELSWGILITSSDAYEILSQFVFRGSTALGTPISMDAIVQINGATDGSLRIYDVTNALTICEVTAFTDTSWMLKSLGTISNIPTGQAIFEVQMKRTGTGGQSAEIAALSVAW